MGMARSGVKKGHGYDWRASPLENSMVRARQAIHVREQVLRTLAMRWQRYWVTALA